MTVTNSNLNISQLSLQSLKEESFSEVPLTEAPRLPNANGNKYSLTRRVASTSHLPTVGNLTSNNKSSTSIVGLGIRRPSDSIPVSGDARKDRPFSSYSTVSTSSETSSQDEFNSRVSSLTSYTASPFISPVIPEHKQRDANNEFKRANRSNNDVKSPNISTTAPHQQRPSASPRTPRINTNIKAQSTSALPKDLTPQQKYRLRRSQSKATLREIESRYDAYESDDEIADDTFVWNVPLAIGGAASFFANDQNCQSPKLVNKMLNGSSSSTQFQMPPSELPGALQNSRSTPNLPVSPALRKQRSFAHLSPAAKEISAFYTHTTTDYVESEMSARKSFSERLPLQVLQAQKHGFDDFRMISKEKASSFSSSRPVWLPPKSSDEIKRHDKQIHKVLDGAARADLKSKAALLQKKQTDMANVERYRVLMQKSPAHFKAKHAKECGTLLLETEMPRELEFDLLMRVAFKIHPGLSHEMLKKEYEQLCAKMALIDFTPRTREFERTSRQISKNYPLFQDETSVEFKRLQWFLKLEHICEFELFPFVTSKLIAGGAGYTDLQIYCLLRVFNSTVMDDNFLQKYYSQLAANPVMQRKLSPSFFKDDLDNLSLKHFLSVLPQEIMLRVLKISICIPDYKLFYAAVLTMLRDYHFGFNSVKDLVAEGKELDFETPVDADKFFTRMSFYYKKF